MTTIRMARTMMTMRMITTMTTTSSPSSLTVASSFDFDLKETDFPVGLSLEPEGEFSSSAPSVFFSESLLLLSPLFSPAVSEEVELVLNSVSTPFSSTHFLDFRMKPS